MSLTSAALVSVVALMSPLLIRLTRAPVPDVVGQILLGIAIGPQVLGIAKVDEPVRVLSVIGLSFLLLLGGLEIEPGRLRGGILRLASVGYALSFSLALFVGFGLAAVDLLRSPVLVAVLLSSTSLGIVLPVMTDARLLDTPLGRSVAAGSSVAEVVPIVLLSLLFSGEAGGIGRRLILFAIFAAILVVGAALILGFERWPRLSASLIALQDTTAEVRVRGAIALLMSLAAAAAGLGLEAILGAFLAGLVLSLLDRDEAMTHTRFRTKIRAVGFGALVPFFFVGTGMSLDVGSLVEPSTLLRVPIFLGALLLARAVPAVVYFARLIRWRHVAAAGLLQATSLSIPVVGGQIGVNLGLIRPANYVALLAAGLVSVVLFPQLALVLTKTAPLLPDAHDQILPRRPGERAGPAV